MAAIRTGVIPVLDTPAKVLLAMHWAGMNVQQTAAAIGVERNTVSRWVAGKTRPGRPALMALAMATGVDVDWLRDDESPAGGTGGAAVRPEGFEPPTF